MGSEPEEKFEGIDWPDYLVIGVYFVTVLVVGLYSSWKSNRSSAGGYFLASRKMHFIPVGASLFASNIGSGHFMGLAGTAAASGVGIAAFEFSAIFFILMLGWLFVPVYVASGVYTMPEYLRKRFGGQRIRIYQSGLAILLYVFTKISADLYAGALFITEATKFGKDGGNSDAAIYIAMLILLGIAALFTISGGLSAVIWTDLVQTIIMVGGSIALAVMAFVKTEGYEKLITDYFNNSTAANRSYSDPNDNSSYLCGGVPEDAMHLFRSAAPGESDLPWSGMVFGIAVSATWYWCTDQVIVQRTLAAKDMSHVKGGCIIAGYLKLLPLWIMVFPGMAARVLYKDEVACAGPEQCKAVCDSEAGCTNIAYIRLVTGLMPSGVRGLMLAVMLAALMSSLTSVFNSSSTIFATDIYTRIRKQAGETEILIAGRCFVLFLVGVSIGWVVFINQSSQLSQLFVYIQSITSFLAPPICAVFLLAVFWPRANEPGAFWGLMVGLVVGLIRLGLEFGVTNPPCGSSAAPPPDWWLKLVGKVHYLHFGILLMFISGIVTVVVSLLTPAQAENELYRLTYKSRHSQGVRVETSKKGLKNSAFENDENNETVNNTEPSQPERQHEIQESAEEEEEHEIPVWKKIVNFLCGISPKSKTIANQEEPDPVSKEDEAIMAAEKLKEKPKWQNLANLNAVILVSITCFIWGYYA